MIRHGARAQSPPLDIMCLPVARTRTHRLPRVCARASVTVHRPPKCIRSIIGFSLSYSSRSTVLAADVETSPNLRRFTLGPRLERKSLDDGPLSARHADREKMNGTRYTCRSSVSLFSPSGPRARGARKRARRHGALLTISRDCRSHPRSPPLVCHPTNSLSAARERSQVRVRRAYTLSRAPRSSRAGALVRLLLSQRSGPRRRRLRRARFEILPFLYFHRTSEYALPFIHPSRNGNKIIFIPCKM